MKYVHFPNHLLVPLKTSNLLFELCLLFWVDVVVWPDLDQIEVLIIECPNFNSSFYFILKLLLKIKARVWDTLPNPYWSRRRSFSAIINRSWSSMAPIPCVSSSLSFSRKDNFFSSFSISWRSSGTPEIFLFLKKKDRKKWKLTSYTRFEIMSQFSFPT